MRGIEKLMLERAIVHQVDAGPSGLGLSGGVDVCASSRGDMPKPRMLA